MLTNGLSDANGSATACQQQLTVNFDFDVSGITSLQRLRRSDGQVEVVPLTHLSGSLYQYVFTLDGGTGDLFKFNDGAPFVGIQSASAATLYWDNDGSASGNNSSTGAGLGGSGTWDSAASFSAAGRSLQPQASRRHALLL